MQESIRIDKTILRVGVTIVITMLLQLGAGLWQFSSMSSELRHLKEDLSKLEGSVATGTQNRYTSNQAQTDKSMMLQLLAAINNRIDLAERRIERLEGQ